MFHKNFRVVISQRVNYDSKDAHTMTLSVFKALLPASPFDVMHRFAADSKFQFQGHWTYYDSNSSTKPTLGNAAPKEQRFWRYHYRQQEFKFMSIGTNTDGTDAIDESAVLYTALPDDSTGLRVAPGTKTANGFILRQSAFFRSGSMTWDTTPYFDDPGYEP